MPSFPGFLLKARFHGFLPDSWFFEILPAWFFWASFRSFLLRARFPGFLPGWFSWFSPMLVFLVFSQAGFRGFLLKVRFLVFPGFSQSVFSVCFFFPRLVFQVFFLRFLILCRISGFFNLSQAGFAWVSRRLVFLLFFQSCFSWISLKLVFLVFS